MTPKLEQFVQLARNRVYRHVSDGEPGTEIQTPKAIQEFKLSLNRMIDPFVQYELFSAGSIWDRTQDGCSIQFTVEDDTFVLQETGDFWKLSHRIAGKNVPIATLSPDLRFEDRLLIAIDDAVRGEN